MNRSWIPTLSKTLNVLELLVVLLILFAAVSFQVILSELPCPLCLLQRVGFLGVVFALLLNLKFGLRPSHYGLALFSALFTAVVALRQIALHAIPGTGSYGSSVMGLHMYTWSFVAAICMIVATAFILSFDRQYDFVPSNTRLKTVLTHLLFVIFLLMVMFNLVSTYLECGFKECPDNPLTYLSIYWRHFLAIV